MSRSLVLFVPCFLLLAACGGESDTSESLVLDDDPTSEPEPTTEPDPEPTCGAIELCERSTQECGYDVTVEQCATWYDDPANCLDMEAYTACNCDCLPEERCQDYYACGELCFAQHCV